MPPTTPPLGRIAHILPWPSIGGTELQTLRLAQTARQLGYLNVIFVPVGANKVRALFADERFEVFDYKQVQPSYTKPAAFWKNSQELAKQLRVQQVRVVHSSDIHATYFTALAGRMAGAKVISHVRNYYPKFEIRDKSFLLPVELFVFVSKTTREHFAFKRARRISQVLYDVPGVAYKPVDDRAAARAHFGLPSSGHVFGMAARVSRQKDFPTLIRAAKLVTERLPDCRFLIAGDYQLEASHRAHYQSLQSLLDETGMRSRFLFAGFQSEMSTFYGAIDTFVLSSNWEGLPTVVLEAILYDRPVVSSEVGGIAEAIRDGVDGFLVPTESPEVLAERLVKIETDKELARQFTNSARDVLTSVFGPERFSNQVDALYSALIRKS